MRRHHQTVVGTLLAVVSLLGLIQPAGAAVQYTVTDLGSVNGAPNRINQSGQAAGFIATPGAADQGFLWNGTAMQTLGTLAGSTRALGLNDTGMVVGWSSVKPYPSSDRHAFLWQNGLMQDLNTTGGPSLQWALDVNNAGQIVIHGATSGYLWQQGALTDLHFQDPLAINQAGQVVGGRNTGRLDSTQTPIDEPVLWDHGTITPLGTLGGTGNSLAIDVNDHGQVVGYADPGSSYPIAFVWESGTMRAVPLPFAGSPSSYAFGINDSGQIVGRAYRSDWASRAFLYSNGISADLNNAIPAGSGWVLATAYDINDVGQIVGTGTFNGSSRMFLLTPVPEPASILLLMGSACAILRRRK